MKPEIQYLKSDQWLIVNDWRSIYKKNKIQQLEFGNVDCPIWQSGGSTFQKEQIQNPMDHSLLAEQGFVSTVESIKLRNKNIIYSTIVYFDDCEIMTDTWSSKRRYLKRQSRLFVVILFWKKVNMVL